jgi:hypothetical protein
MSVFERAKTVHALDRAATVIGKTYLSAHSYYSNEIVRTYSFSFRFV